jgi:hypothetical protein
VKKRCEPSGEKVGVPSLAGPETMPGAKSVGDGGVGVVCAWRRAAVAAARTAVERVLFMVSCPRF